MMPRVSAQQHGRQHLVDMRRRAARTGASHRLANADQSLVGLDAHDHRALTQQRIVAHAEGRQRQFRRDVAVKGIGEGGEEGDGFDFGDFHWWACLGRAKTRVAQRILPFVS